MTRSEERQRLMAFLDGVRRPDVALESIDDNANLVAAGVIDSLMLFEIITFLESEFQVDFSGSDFTPERVTTISNILDLIAGQRR